MADKTAASFQRGPSGLPIAAAGLIAAILLLLLFAACGPFLLISADSQIRIVSGYLVFWVPLIVATVWWARTHPLAWREMVRFRALDLLWGLVVGLLARALASVIEWLAYGGVGAGGGLVMLDAGQPNPVMVAVTVVIAPVILAPVIEELFFRGVLLTSLRAGSTGRGAAAVAIVASAVIFALVHLLQVTSFSAVVAIGASTLVLGLATGILAVTTGRLGGAIVAHIIFNGVVLLPALIG